MKKKYFLRIDDGVFFASQVLTSKMSKSALRSRGIFIGTPNYITAYKSLSNELLTIAVP